MSTWCELNLGLSSQKIDESTYFRNKAKAHSFVVDKIETVFPLSGLNFNFRKSNRLRWKELTVHKQFHDQQGKLAFFSNWLFQ